MDAAPASASASPTVATFRVRPSPRACTSQDAAGLAVSPVTPSPAVPRRSCSPARACSSRRPTDLTGLKSTGNNGKPKRLRSGPASPSCPAESTSHRNPKRPQTDQAPETGEPRRRRRPQQTRGPATACPAPSPAPWAATGQAVHVQPASWDSSKSTTSSLQSSFAISISSIPPASRLTTGAPRVRVKPDSFKPARSPTQESLSPDNTTRLHTGNLLSTQPPLPSPDVTANLGTGSLPVFYLPSSHPNVDQQFAEHGQQASPQLTPYPSQIQSLTGSLHTVLPASALHLGSLSDSAPSGYSSQPPTKRLAIGHNSYAEFVPVGTEPNPAFTSPYQVQSSPQGDSFPTEPTMTYGQRQTVCDGTYVTPANPDVVDPFDPYGCHPASTSAGPVPFHIDPNADNIYNVQQQPFKPEPMQADDWVTFESAGISHQPQTTHNPYFSVEGEGHQLMSGDASESDSEVVPGAGETEDARIAAREIARKARTAFDQEQRAKTGETRKLKACVRCRNQRIRCLIDEDNPSGPCLTCKNVSQDNKKVIHRLPCLRMKCTEIVLFRSGQRYGSLNLTRRWDTPQLKDVGDWADFEVRTIHISLGLCSEPIELNVRKFHPVAGDVLARYWVDGIARKRKELEPYALADIAKAAEYFKDYVERNAGSSLQRELATSDSDPLIQETYRFAWRHFQTLENITRQRGTVPTQEQVFMANLFKLWFAIRHTVGSSWIQGEDKLGMLPETKDESYPLFGGVSVPRMIVAQFDNMNYLRLLNPLRTAVLKQLETMLNAKNHKVWFTVYVSVFILLHEVSVACRDRYRHGLQNSARMRYSLPQFVEELQHGANVLLAHWHYYRRGVLPLNLKDRFGTSLRELTPEQYNFVVKSYKVMKARHDDIQVMKDTTNWEHELYWVSQMLQEEEWEPGPIFVA